VVCTCLAVDPRVSGRALAHVEGVGGGLAHAAVHAGTAQARVARPRYTPKPQTGVTLGSGHEIGGQG
jgi:hypothetical protein